jgi:hypothetical protein
MVEAKRNQILRDAELNAFKLGNNLYHPATYPTDMAKHMSWVVITLAIETLVNAAFFAGANSLIFGALVAFAVSVVNLVVKLYASPLPWIGEQGDSKVKINL